MMHRRVLILSIAVTLFAAFPAAADNVSGADELICASTQATVCNNEGECKTGPPSSWAIPRFVEINLAAKLLKTTEASGQNRATPIQTVARSEGLVILQGSEMGRAFSLVISEKDGTLAAAVARAGVTVSVFGACTPLGQ